MVRFIVWLASLHDDLLNGEKGRCREWNRVYCPDGPLHHRADHLVAWRGKLATKSYGGSAIELETVQLASPQRRRFLDFFAGSAVGSFRHLPRFSKSFPEFR